ncbi:HNH endonuclease signature motif containing protein [Paenibacillus anseongense]|uniref:HNH endonuclease n=1 Tax=Paenibacillus anseongense TaxID=2682845 RepID=UPI002DBDE628|nr:HNH endonuclease signature motif containing protein [Paenibacillus anseongense]MEC0269370.1 HNH endonuclease signature motif containing protein [Paenibacillus anseongense]
MNTKINQEERAFRAWDVLGIYAKDKKTITYKELGEKLNVHYRTCRYFLDYIQNYCMENKLPPLTIIVVNQEGIVGTGFTAWDTDNLAEGLNRVFKYNWDNQPNPFSFAEDGTTSEEIVEQLLNNVTDKKEIYVRVKVRGIIQTVFRRALLQVYNNKCAFCGFSHVVALEASHIVPWSHSTDEERVSVNNGILLCSNHHKLFDSGILKINKDYKIEATLPFNSNILGKKIRLPKLKKHYPNVNNFEKRNKIITN